MTSLVLALALTAQAPPPVPPAAATPAAKPAIVSMPWPNQPRPAAAVNPEPLAISVTSGTFGGVTGTWVTVGNTIVAHYYDRRTGQIEECLFDARTNALISHRGTPSGSPAPVGAAPDPAGPPLPPLP